MDRTQGAALFSLMRNIGSSIGISVMTFLLIRNTTIMHADMTTHVNPFNLGLHLPGLMRNWDITSMSGKAALNAEIGRQSQVIAYANDYRLMMYVALASIPLALLLRRPGRSHGHAAAAAAAD